MRIEQLVQEAGVVPSRAVIAEAVNVLVYMEKVGTRRIVKDIINVRGAGDTFVVTSVTTPSIEPSNVIPSP
jgi:hypothetical protein